MKIYVVFHSRMPLCAFVDEDQAETFKSILEPNPEIRNRELRVGSLNLMKHIGPKISDVVEDEDEVDGGGEPIFLSYSPMDLMSPISVTRNLDDARMRVLGMSGKGDVVAIDLFPPGAKMPGGPRYEYVSSFGPGWPLSMHERWRRHMSYTFRTSTAEPAEQASPSRRGDV